jgi:ABC-type polysaccharide/polyol phosphate export permease
MTSPAVSLPLGFGYFVRDLFRSRHLIFQLSMREFRARYLGSALGIVWALVHPSITILLYWFVLQLWFKNPNVDNVPFVLWLMPGIVPFMFMSEAIGGGATSIVENGYLVKKVVFRVNMLPVVRLLALIPIHLAFVGVTLILLLCYRLPITVFALQVPYYFVAGCCLALGISFFTSALMPFLRDTNQVISVLVQFLFYLTPVLWRVSNFTDKPVVMGLLKVNPLFYLIEGYRESLLPTHPLWFWRHPVETAYFWIVTLGFMIVGMLTFKRLRPHFADVV